MSWIAQKCILAYGWHRALILIIAGAITGLSMPPLFFLPALFLAMPVWVWCLDGAEREPGLGRLFGPAFRIGFSFGFGFFLTSLHWIGFAFLGEAGWTIYVMPFAIMALAAVLSIYWGLASALAHLFWSNNWTRLIALSVFLAGAEYLRGTLFTGFPFNLVGYALTANETMMQIASVTGIYGLTLLAILLAFPLALVWPADDRPLTSRLMPLFGVLGVLALQLGYGQYRLVTTDVTMRDDMRMRLVQPGITQAQKWQAEGPQFVLDRMISLSQTQTGPNNAGLIGITHLIWPESSLPFFLKDYPGSLVRIADMLPPGTNLLLGVPRLEFSPSRVEENYNAILSLNSDGEVLASYDKTHLVPVGEFLPFKQIFDRIGLQQFVNGSNGWSHGDARRLMNVASTPPFLPLICYEAIFSGQLFTTDNDVDVEAAQFILNLTNDGWFDNSIGPAQHFHHARLRAVEHGIPMVRVANSGRSAVIGPLGRLVGVMNPGETGLIDVDMPNRIQGTYFSQNKHLPFLITLLLGLFFVIAKRFGRGNS